MKNKWLKSCIDVLIIIIILSISITCLISMLLCINTFIENQKAFNEAYTKATTSLVNLINNNIESGNNSIDIVGDIALDNLSNALTYLENLQLIQKNSTTNDLMSFIYSLLSTILVGLCAGFVVKSKKNADNAQKVALEAQENAQKSEISKKTVENIQKETEKNIQSAEKLKLEASNQIAIHKNNMIILSIHVEITHARYFLDAHNQVESNKRIYEINKNVCSLNGSCDSSSIRQLRDELLVLKSAVDSFNSAANSCNDDNKKISMQKAASRYFTQLNEAILTCDNIIRL